MRDDLVGAGDRPLPANHEELTPLSFLERSVLIYGDRVAVVHEDRRYTYSELGERVSRLASTTRSIQSGRV